MARFRKKPVVIEAVQWIGSNITEVLNFGMTGPVPLWGDDYSVNREASQVSILTSEGKMTASLNDWIIRGVKGEFYPCKPDIFAATYEAVDDGT
jgi:hypothetical protein